MSSRAEQFVEVYREARAADQRAYYERLARRNETAHGQLLVLSAVVFGLSGTVGLLAGVDTRWKAVFAVFAVVLPAMTTVLLAYDGLYAFERIAKLYRDAERNLRRIDPPQLDRADDQQATTARYVAEVEAILAKERAQWGQLVVEAAKREPA